MVAILKMAKLQVFVHFCTFRGGGRWKYVSLWLKNGCHLDEYITAILKMQVRCLSIVFVYVRPAEAMYWIFQTCSQILCDHYYEEKKNSNYFFPNYEIKVINAISDIWYNQSCLKTFNARALSWPMTTFYCKILKQNKNQNFEFIRITANI